VENVYFGSPAGINGAEGYATVHLLPIWRRERGTVTANDRDKFGTYWRDTMSSWDYADQQYYQSSWGRFTSPDPYKASASTTTPHSWNRYVYAENDPVNFNDQSRLATCDVVSIVDDQSGVRAELYCRSEGGTVSYQDWIDVPGAPRVRNGKDTRAIEKSSFEVGDVIWFPGHVGIVTGVDASGSVTSFVGSQSSTGPAEVQVANDRYWRGRLGSAKAYKPCVPGPKEPTAKIHVIKPPVEAPKRNLLAPWWINIFLIFTTPMPFISVPVESVTSSTMHEIVTSIIRYQ
jgi:RHS repeat-associated protein